ncbi:hypothetical protein NH340_JMT00119 [Sarcoptes scabiei]|nr:hypothetical protein NH340_JMT00119 [Sarcoptes scabiei]
MISIKRSTSRVSSAGGGGGSKTQSQNIRSMTKCGRCCYYCRLFMTFIFSHIGLGTMLLGYALIGAFTFQALESEHEQRQRKKMLETRDLLIYELSKMTNRSLVLKQDRWTREAAMILKNFELKFLHAVKYEGYDGNEDTDRINSQWSFSGALLYSITVITTIGYGNVVPRTDWGKIVTILYAIIGIPLMLFCLSNIGHTMAHSFKFIYWKCCCFLCVEPKKVKRQRRKIRRRKRRRRRHQTKLLQNSLQSQQSTSSFVIDCNQLDIPLKTLKHSKCFEPISIVDKQPSSQQSSRSSRSPSTRSAALLGGIESRRQSIRKSISSLFIADQKSIPSSNTLQVPQFRPNLSRSLSARYHSEMRMNKKDKKDSIEKFEKIPIICNRYVSESHKFETDFEENSTNRQQQILKASQVRFESPLFNVNPSKFLPIKKNQNQNQNRKNLLRSNSLIESSLLSKQKISDISSNCNYSRDFRSKRYNGEFALVIGYICGGACFFSSSEDWSFLDASYFCFITLSTIGFGDLVPGRTVFSTPEDGQMTLAICALYLLFGMALLAMSLNLVKEKVLETVRIIGQRIGILVKDEDEDDDSNG